MVADILGLFLAAGGVMVGVTSISTTVAFYMGRSRRKVDEEIRFLEIQKEKDMALQKVEFWKKEAERYQTIAQPDMPFSQRVQIVGSKIRPSQRPIFNELVRDGFTLMKFMKKLPK